MTVELKSQHQIAHEPDPNLDSNQPHAHRYTADGAPDGITYDPGGHAHDPGRDPLVNE